MGEACFAIPFLLVSFVAERLSGVIAGHHFGAPLVSLVQWLVVNQVQPFFRTRSLRVVYALKSLL